MGGFLLSASSPQGWKGGRSNVLRTSTAKRPQVTVIACVLAALAEIAGCFAFWAGLRLDKPMCGSRLVSLALLVRLPPNIGGR